MHPFREGVTRSASLFSFGIIDVFLSLFYLLHLHLLCSKRFVHPSLTREDGEQFPSGSPGIGRGEKKGWPLDFY
ncbi:hypothetical protein JTE90_008023 [Oedothorax gibbosus]|uniref:Uncharacterized protein n=1 Tax=Oedothorax gibbosus TaxID=931172 RepID=A0AAV6UXE1_9ARAC|nr:hypothetical protein JTE90_008023 [Oedothorax gibbosus]